VSVQAELKRLRDEVAKKNQSTSELEVGTADVAIVLVVQMFSCFFCDVAP
jgi:hypothetical protein